MKKTMEPLDKLSALKYIAHNNPVCDDCARGNLDQVRKAAGLYQVVKEISISQKEIFDKEELNKLIKQAISY